MAWLCPRAASGPWASAFFSSRRGPNTCLEETKWGEVLAQESAESCRGCTSWSPLSQATSERGRKEALKAADDRGRGGLGQPGGSGPRSWSLGVQSSRQGELGASGGGAGSAIAFTASPGKRPWALTGWSSGHGAHLLDSPAPRLVTFLQGVLDTLPWIWAWTPEEAGTLPPHLGRPSEWDPVVSAPGPGVGSLELPASTQPSGLPAGLPCLQSPSQP